MRGSKRFDPEQWLAQWAEVHGVTTPSVRIDGSVGSVPVGAGGVVTLSGERFILLSRGPSEEDLLALSAAALNAVTLAAEFDEDEHPRNPAGGPHGGEFAAKPESLAPNEPFSHDDLRIAGYKVPMSPDLVRATGFTYNPSRLLLESVDYGASEVIDEHVDNMRPSAMDPDSPAWTKMAREETAKYVGETNAKIQRMVDEATPVIKMGSYTLADALGEKDQRFKNQHETGTSGGWLNQDVRVSAEDRMFGQYADNSRRPIYGALTNDVSKVVATNRLAQYGDVAIELDPSVKQSATVSFGDSLAAYTEGGLVPRPAASADFIAFPLEQQHDTLRDSTNVDDYWDRTGKYVEMQVHGGLGFDKIRAIYAPKLERAGKDWDEDSKIALKADRDVLARIGRVCHARGIKMHFVQQETF